MADENLHLETVEFLRSEGFSIKDVKEEKLIGASDQELPTIAKQEGRIILTHDSDFGKLVFAQKLPFVGIIYLRPGHFNANFHITTLKAIPQANPELTTPFILVAENSFGNIRIRIRNALHIL